MKNINLVLANLLLLTLLHLVSLSKTAGQSVLLTYLQLILINFIHFIQQNRSGKMTTMKNFPTAIYYDNELVIFTWVERSTS